MLFGVLYFEKQPYTVCIYYCILYAYMLGDTNTSTVAGQPLHGSFIQLDPVNQRYSYTYKRY